MFRSAAALRSAPNFIVERLSEDLGAALGRSVVYDGMLSNPDTYRESDKCCWRLGAT